MVHGVITRVRLDGAGLFVSSGDVEHDLRQPLGVEPESRVMEMKRSQTW